ncbi:outer membrane protein assembly factor BamA [Hyphomicrobium sp. DMF-1]|uniref:outer membrane protein assembly factor BamA n=1 Tax=Hyphomicrobium sp. DMF-1 TaxID=3019544 RepID=UPI0022EBE914|nr:outer membrane protein assembly factor BamA [Hyphomicrobium sp. DMF-1]WBT36948.1 outer membrane protein assembly factor BamA [Hyphomicrobium sp. DMF-1]
MASPAQAQGVVREIRVEGNRRVEPETVRSYLQFSVGEAYDAGKVDRSLQALFATGLFADVSIDQDGQAVVIYVVENPVINQVAFEGNSEVDTDTLRAEVQLKPRSVYTRARVQGDVQRILDVYRRQGRFAASVEPKIIELEQSRVNLVFEINEGGATKVQGVNFVGNHAFSDAQLRDIVSTTQSGWFDFLKGTSIYDPDRMNLDRELLRQFYLKNGYADVRVVAANAELDREGSGFYVNFAIDEGELYTFGNVTIESSLPGADPQSLIGEVLTHQGETYNGADIDKSAEKLTLLTAEQGFAFARVRPRAVPDPATRTIALTYIVDEGPRIYIERINISGNLRTKDHVIRREFRLAEGDAYNPLLVDRAKKRLNGLGFFKSVDIKRRPGSAQDRVVLDVDLVEQSTGELSFGAGYSTSEGVIGDVSISERNLLGNGQFLRLKLAGSLERMQVDLSFTEPRFLDRNLSAGFDLFHKEVDQTDESGFSSTRTGGTVRLGFPLSENLWMQTGYTLDYSTIDVEAKYLNRVSNLVIEEINTRGEDLLTSSFGTSLTYDKRNHPKNPTSGYYLQVSGDMAGLGGDVQYVRVNGEGRAYYPISEKITFVGRLIGGHIEGWGGDDIRLTDLYYRGGETIRGFDRGGFGPRDLLTNDAIGGTTYWASTAEIRFPLPFIPDDLGLSGAVFADAGSLFNANDLAKSLNGKPVADNGIVLADDSSIRSSVGASIMWNSPVGPIRMDFAKALTKEKYDEEQFFRFGASTKF